MSETKTYQGGCHCGKVRFEFAANIEKLTSCNCSICSKMGWLLTFVPKADFKLVSGEESLTDYQFGKKNIHHLFCSTCGIRSFGRGATPDGKEICAVNTRCLDDFDAKALPCSEFDGKAL